jgi:hypothetical protein
MLRGSAMMGSRWRVVQKRQVTFLDWARHACMHLDGGKVEDEPRVGNGEGTGRKVTVSSSWLLDKKRGRG